MHHVLSDRRRARCLLFPVRLVLGSLVVFVVLLVGGAVPAFSFASAGTSSGTTTVQLPQRLCAVAVPGESSCLAIRLVTRQVSSATAAKLREAGLARPAAVSSVASGPAGGYSPGQLAAAYGVNPATATSQTVAIVDAFEDPSVTADLDAFDAQYGLPAETSTSFKAVSQTGGSASGIITDVGWAGEIALDVEAVRGLCHACKILLVEANSSNNSDLGAAVDEAVSLGATIVSNSYGGTEFPSDPQAGDYNHQGVAILASTGDDGWYGWDGFNLGVASNDAPQIPASYSTVVGVGGTTLDLNPDGTRASETVWNDNGPLDAEGYAFANTYGITGGAAGSGCSSIYTAQTWQQDVSGYSTLGCGATFRNGVDIAADADYFTGFDTYETTSWCTGTDGNGNACPASNPGWETIGGTSLASPLVAAMWALAGGPAGVNYPAMTLYGHFHTAPAQLYDVTVGGNAACDNRTPRRRELFDESNQNTPGAGLLDCIWGPTGISVLTNIDQCNAQLGYDGVSGVGTPKGVAPFQPLSPIAVIQAPGTVTPASPTSSAHRVAARRSPATRSSSTSGAGGRADDDDDCCHDESHLRLAGHEDRHADGDGQRLVSEQRAHRQQVDPAQRSGGRPDLDRRDVGDGIGRDRLDAGRHRLRRDVLPRLRHRDDRDAHGDAGERFGLFRLVRRLFRHRRLQRDDESGPVGDRDVHPQVFRARLPGPEAEGQDVCRREERAYEGPLQGGQGHEEVLERQEGPCDLPEAEAGNALGGPTRRSTS